MKVNVGVEGVGWAMEKGMGVRENVEMAVDRFRARYGDEPVMVVVGEDWVGGDEVCGLRVVKGVVAPGTIMVARGME